MQRNDNYYSNGDGSTPYSTGAGYNASLSPPAPPPVMYQQVEPNNTFGGLGGPRRHGVIRGLVGSIAQSVQNSNQNQDQNQSQSRHSPYGCNCRNGYDDNGYACSHDNNNSIRGGSPLGGFRGRRDPNAPRGIVGRLFVMANAFVPQPTPQEIQRKQMKRMQQQQLQVQPQQNQQSQQQQQQQQYFPPSVAPPPTAQGYSQSEGNERYWQQQSEFAPQPPVDDIPPPQYTAPSAPTLPHAPGDMSKS
ncbi:hypothetical protein EMPS_07486 [Entomortierella parvispora]|uniref:Uncharacterized protein n=1 Tax=Entomortierella parvispora TaxID=205924 RepID=A0A9P3LYH6_9FUNG|nr:hypothetical protein EMPS_07486 [Entomortierella parvispora]